MAWRDNRLFGADARDDRNIVWVSFGQRQKAKAGDGVVPVNDDEADMFKAAGIAAE